MEVNFTSAAQVPPSSILVHLDELLSRTSIDIELISEFYQTLQSVPDEMAEGLEDRRYQIRAKKKIIEAFLEGRRRGQLIMGTGGGKTAVAMSIIAQTKGRTLWLAPSKIAVNRGISEAEKFAPHKTWHRPKGKDFQDFDDTKDITFGTSSMFIYGEKGANGGGDEEHARNDEELTSQEEAAIVRRFKQFPPDYFDIIVLDEAHHFMGKVIKEIAEHFTGACQLYMTATPANAKSHVDDIVPDHFDDTCSSDYLIDKEGYPSVVYYPMVAEGEHLEKATVNNRIQIKDGQEGEVLNMPFRYQATLQAFETAIEKGEKILGFLPSVNSSYNFIHNAALKAHPDWAGKIAHVDGSMNAKEIEDIERKFRSGEILGVTCNALWEESLDVPDIQHIVLANPTTSPRRIEQAIGRGRRPAEGKTHLYLWDVVSSLANLTPEQLGNTRTPVSIPELLGFEEVGYGQVLEGPNRGKKLVTTAPAKRGADVPDLVYADFKRGELQYLEYNERIRNMAFLRDGKVAANLYRCFAENVFDTHPLNLILSPDLFMDRDEKVQVQDENTGLEFMITFKDAFHAAKLYRALDNIQEEILQDVDVLCDQVHERVVDVLAEELKFEKYRQSEEEYYGWFIALLENYYDGLLETQGRDEFEDYLHTTQWMDVAMGMLTEVDKLRPHEMEEGMVTELALWMAGDSSECAKAKQAFIRASRTTLRLKTKPGLPPIPMWQPDYEGAQEAIQDGRIGARLEGYRQAIVFEKYRCSVEDYAHWIEDFLLYCHCKDELFALLRVEIFAQVATSIREEEGGYITEVKDEAFIAGLTTWLMKDNKERAKANEALRGCIKNIILYGDREARSALPSEIRGDDFYVGAATQEELKKVLEHVHIIVNHHESSSVTSSPETLEFEAFRPNQETYETAIWEDGFRGNGIPDYAPPGFDGWLRNDLFMMAAMHAYSEWENEEFLAGFARWLMSQPEERKKAKAAMRTFISHKENKGTWVGALASGMRVKYIEDEATRAEVTATIEYHFKKIKEEIAEEDSLVEEARKRDRIPRAMQRLRHTITQEVRANGPTYADLEEAIKQIVDHYLRHNPGQTIWYEMETGGEFKENMLAMDTGLIGNLRRLTDDLMWENHLAMLYVTDQWPDDLSDYIEKHTGDLRNMESLAVSKMQALAQLLNISPRSSALALNIFGEQYVSQQEDDARSAYYDNLAAARAAVESAESDIDPNTSIGEAVFSEQVHSLVLIHRVDELKPEESAKKMISNIFARAVESHMNTLRRQGVMCKENAVELEESFKKNPVQVGYAMVAIANATGISIEEVRSLCVEMGDELNVPPSMHETLFSREVTFDTQNRQHLAHLWGQVKDQLRKEGQVEIKVSTIDYYLEKEGKDLTPSNRHFFILGFFVGLANNNFSVNYDELEKDLADEGSVMLKLESKTPEEFEKKERILRFRAILRSEFIQEGFGQTWNDYVEDVLVAACEEGGGWDSYPLSLDTKEAKLLSRMKARFQLFGVDLQFKECGEGEYKAQGVNLENMMPHSDEAIPMLAPKGVSFRKNGRKLVLQVNGESVASLDSIVEFSRNEVTLRWRRKTASSFENYSNEIATFRKAMRDAGVIGDILPVKEISQSMRKITFSLDGLPLKRTSELLSEAGSDQDAVYGILLDQNIEFPGISGGPQFERLWNAGKEVLREGKPLKLDLSRSGRDYVQYYMDRCVEALRRKNIHATYERRQSSACQIDLKLENRTVEEILEQQRRLEFKQILQEEMMDRGAFGTEWPPFVEESLIPECEGEGNWPNRSLRLPYSAGKHGDLHRHAIESRLRLFGIAIRANDYSTAEYKILDVDLGNIVPRAKDAIPMTVPDGVYLQPGGKHTRLHVNGKVLEWKYSKISGDGKTLQLATKGVNALHGNVEKMESFRSTLKWAGVKGHLLPLVAMSKSGAKVSLSLKGIPIQTSVEVQAEQKASEETLSLMSPEMHATLWDREFDDLGSFDGERLEKKKLFVQGLWNLIQARFRQNLGVHVVRVQKPELIDLLVRYGLYEPRESLEENFRTLEELECAVEWSMNTPIKVTIGKEDIEFRLKERTVEEFEEGERRIKFARVLQSISFEDSDLDYVWRCVRSNHLMPVIHILGSFEDLKGKKLNVTGQSQKEIDVCLNIIKNRLRSYGVVAEFVRKGDKGEYDIFILNYDNLAEEPNNLVQPFNSDSAMGDVFDYAIAAYPDLVDEVWQSPSPGAPLKDTIKYGWFIKRALAEGATSKTLVRSAEALMDDPGIRKEFAWSFDRMKEVKQVNTKREDGVLGTYLAGTTKPGRRTKNWQEIPAVKKFIEECLGSQVEESVVDLANAQNPGVSCLPGHPLATVLARLKKNEPQVEDYIEIYGLISKQTGLSLSALASAEKEDPQRVRLRYLPFLVVAVGEMKREGEDWRYLAENRMTDDFEVANLKKALGACGLERKVGSKIFQQISSVRMVPAPTTWHEHPEVHAIMRELLGEAEYNRIEKPETREIHTTVEDYQAIFHEFIRERRGVQGSMAFKESSKLLAMHRSTFRDFVFVLLAQDALRPGELNWAMHAEPLMNSRKEQAKAVEALMREMPKLDRAVVKKLFKKTTNEHGRMGWRNDCKFLLKERRARDLGALKEKWGEIRADFKAVHAPEAADKSPERREATIKDYRAAITQIMLPKIEREKLSEPSKGKEGGLMLDSDSRFNSKLKVKTYALVAYKMNAHLKPDFKTLRKAAISLIYDKRERERGAIALELEFPNMWTSPRSKFLSSGFNPGLLDEAIAEIMCDFPETTDARLEASPELERISTVEDYRKVFREAGEISRGSYAPPYRGNDMEQTLRYYAFLVLALKRSESVDKWDEALIELVQKKGEKDKAAEAFIDVLIERGIGTLPSHSILRKHLFAIRVNSSEFKNSSLIQEMKAEILDAQTAEPTSGPNIESPLEIPPGPSVEEYKALLLGLVEKWDISNPNRPLRNYNSLGRKEIHEFQLQLRFGPFIKLAMKIDIDNWQTIAEAWMNDAKERSKISTALGGMAMHMSPRVHVGPNTFYSLVKERARDYPKGGYRHWAGRDIIQRIIEDLKGQVIAEAVEMCVEIPPGPSVEAYETAQNSIIRKWNQENPGVEYARNWYIGMSIHKELRFKLRFGVFMKLAMEEDMANWQIIAEAWMDDPNERDKAAAAFLKATGDRETEPRSFYGVVNKNRRTTIPGGTRHWVERIKIKQLIQETREQIHEEAQLYEHYLAEAIRIVNAFAAGKETTSQDWLNELLLDKYSYGQGQFKARLIIDLYTGVAERCGGSSKEIVEGLMDNPLHQGLARRALIEMAGTEFSAVIELFIEGMEAESRPADWINLAKPFGPQRYPERALTVEKYEKATREVLREWNARTGLNLLEGERDFSDWPEELQTILPGLVYRKVAAHTKDTWKLGGWAFEVQRLSEWPMQQEVAARAVFRVAKQGQPFASDTTTRPQIEAMIEQHREEVIKNEITDLQLPGWAQRIEDWMAGV